MGLDRNYIRQLCELYFPKRDEFFSLGTVGMDHICKEFDGKGTTCGFLPHWLLWKAGCGDTKLINRTEPDSSFKHINGDNIIRIKGSSAFVEYNPENSIHVLGFREGFRSPKIGDFIIIRGESFIFNGKKADSSHVFVLLDNGNINGDQLTYSVCQTGQKNENNVESGHRTTRKFHFKDNKWFASGEVFKDQPPINRFIIGWLNLSACNFSKYWDTHEILFQFATRTSKSSPSPISMVGIWHVASPEYPPGWYYMFHKGYRVFYADGGQPARIAGSGYWFTENNTVNTMWETASGVSEQITMISPLEGIGKVVSFEGSGGNLGIPFIMKKRLETAPAVISSYRDGSGLPMGPPIR